MAASKKEKNEKIDEGIVTSVAKTVGGALGAIAATAADLVGNKKSIPSPAPKPENVHTARASVATKKKRAKHNRKLGRRTKG